MPVELTQDFQKLRQAYFSNPVNLSRIQQNAQSFIGPNWREMVEELFESLPNGVDSLKTLVDCAIKLVSAPGLFEKFLKFPVDRKPAILEFLCGGRPNAESPRTSTC